MSDDTTQDVELEEPSLDEPDTGIDDAAGRDQADQEAMAAEDAEVYEQALQVAGEDQVEYDGEGNLRLKDGVDPYDVLLNHGRDNGARTPIRDEQMPTVLPESKHGQGGGAGGKGGSTGRRKRGTRQATQGGRGGFTLFGLNLHMALPFANTMNGNSILKTGPVGSGNTGIGGSRTRRPAPQRRTGGRR